MKTVNLKFIVRTDKERMDGKCPINIRVSMDNKVAKLMTGVTLFKEDWSKEANFIKRNKDLEIEKKRLRSCMKKVEEYVDNNNRYDIPFSIQDLKDAYNGIDNKNFFHYYDEFLKHKELNDGVTEDTLYIYEVIGKQLYEYRSDLKIGEVDKKFIEKFFIYLKTIKGVNNLYNKHKNLNAFFNKMKRDNLVSENPLRDIPKPKCKPAIVFLTKKEQFDFYDIETEGTGLELSQDAFEFACHTGLRIGDVFSLKKKEVIDGVIIKTQQKVKRIVRVPLVSKPLEILKKYGLDIKKDDDFLFPKKSHQAVNRDLKILAKMAEIDKDINFKVSRHTFGTRLAENGVSAFTIMKLMGHSDIKMTMRYVQDDLDILSNAMNKSDFV